MSAAPGAQPLGTAQRLRAVVIGSLGNFVEWHDFYVYSTFSLYFGDAFFPGDDPLAQTLSTSGVFALGFFMRPIGALLFGAVGDRYGRRVSLMLSVALMCVGSVLIAVAPTHAQAGVLAPALLLFARLLQGLSLGGEYGSSAAYLCEMAEPHRRGLYSSLQYVTTMAGQLLALLELLLLQNMLLTRSQLADWGWRIPFAVGALLAVAALALRRDLHETPAYEAARERPRGKSALRTLMEHPRELALVLGVTLGGTVAFYVYATYMQKYLKLSAGFSDSQTTWISLCAMIYAMCAQPLLGALSDRIGRKPLLIAFGVSGTLLTGPLLSAVKETKDPLVALALICCGWTIVSAYTSIGAVVKSELFPAAVRVTGVALPYAITVSLFGGSAEYVALWFKSQGHESWFYIYASSAIAISLCVYLRMRDTKRCSALDRDFAPPDA